MALVDKQQLEATSPILTDALLEIRRTARKKTLKNHPDNILDPESYFSTLLPFSQKENLKSTCTLISTALSNMATTSIDKLAVLINTDPIDLRISISRRKADFTTDSTLH